MSEDHYNTLINHGEDITITPQTRDEIVEELNNRLHNLSLIEDLLAKAGKLDLPDRVEFGAKKVKVKILLETLK